MNTLNILVVDDEPGIRSGIIRILKNFTVGYPFMDEDFDFELKEAETGESAIEQIEKEKFDIILLDNKLPGIDGVEVLDYISKKKMDLSVMMITSYASLDLAVKATKNGAYNFVPKPFTPQELKSAIEGIAKHLFLKRMTRKMQQHGKEVRFQFLSVLSHELKSPLNAIEGYLQMMHEKQLGENLSDYEKMIGRSMERIDGMRNLIMDLLDLTKLESGKKKRELKETSLNEVAKMAIHTIEPMAIQKNISIAVKADPHILFVGDAEELEIIFNNLISNAVKYNKEGGYVNVDIQKSNESLQIKVTDSGIGMTKEETTRLFQEFVRIRNDKTKHITGSGLGLSIVKKMVENYKGEISVNSTPGQGSSFKVTLPVE